MPGKAHEESKNLSLIFAIPAQENQEPLLKRLDNSEESNCGLLWLKTPTLTTDFTKQQVQHICSYWGFSEYQPYSTNQSTIWILCLKLLGIILELEVTNKGKKKRKSEQIWGQNAYRLRRSERTGQIKDETEECVGKVLCRWEESMVSALVIAFSL